MIAMQVPTSSADKEELINAGLGEMRVDIPNVECSTKEFHEVILKSYPKLREGGGFEFLQCIPNSRVLEPISSTVARSPRLLKSVVNTGRIYIRPLQKNLDLSGMEDTFSSQEVSLAIHKF